MAEKINVGKFINNLDAEDLSSEKLQGVVNNVYAKAIKDHKQTANIADDNLKDLEKETVEFVKSNHDRLKAHKKQAEKEIDKDDATAKEKVAKDLNEDLTWELMPESKVGATFAFKAKLNAHDMEQLIEANHLLYDVVDEYGTNVWLIGHTKNDHIATYVPKMQTLFTDTREAFRNGRDLVEEDFERKLQPGDSIIARGTKATIGKIIDQHYDKKYIDIEFEDDKGNYRSWKSDVDGGRVVYQESLTEDALADAANEAAMHDLMDKVTDEIVKIIDESGFEDNLAFEIAHRIPQYNPDWCSQDVSDFVSRAVEQRKEALARGETDVLFAYAPKELKEAVTESKQEIAEDYLPREKMLAGTAIMPNGKDKYRFSALVEDEPSEKGIDGSNVTYLVVRTMRGEEPLMMFDGAHDKGWTVKPADKELLKYVMNLLQEYRRDYPVDAK